MTPYSVRLRQFLHGLFGSRYVMQLEQDVAEVKRERDYFKGRAERLELMLLPNHNPIARQAVQTKLQAPMRKTWAQIEAENAKELAETAKKEN